MILQWCNQSWNTVQGRRIAHRLACDVQFSKEGACDQAIGWGWRQGPSATAGETRWKAPRETVPGPTFRTAGAAHEQRLRDGGARQQQGHSHRGAAKDAAQSLRSDLKVPGGGKDGAGLHSACVGRASSLHGLQAECGRLPDLLGGASTVTWGSKAAAAQLGWQARSRARGSWQRTLQTQESLSPVCGNVWGARLATAQSHLTAPHLQCFWTLHCRCTLWQGPPSPCLEKHATPHTMRYGGKRVATWACLQRHVVHASPPWPRGQAGCAGEGWAGAHGKLPLLAGCAAQSEGARGLSWSWQGSVGGWPSVGCAASGTWAAVVGMPECVLAGDPAWQCFVRGRS